jgi:hypothetical protein
VRQATTDRQYPWTETELAAGGSDTNPEPESILIRWLLCPVILAGVVGCWGSFPRKMLPISVQLSLGRDLQLFVGGVVIGDGDLSARSMAQGGS